MSNLTKFRRTQQWLTFARLWYLYDATYQDVFDSAIVIAQYLRGMNKPIYDHVRQDVGNHVVVINTSKVSMPVDEWKWRMYSHHSRYGGGQTWAAAHELHSKDPTIVLYKAVYKEVGSAPRAVNLIRSPTMARLHLFPDACIPPEIKANICDQIRQVQPVLKSLKDYSEEEVEKFPKIVDYPEDYVVK
ncbi:putative ribosomal protein L13-like protein [Dinothrombium tinctorium]|uniref:Putative ribosomal protein L13-like protein n=1 Tax=Dinothrombium tinctorium TaxID=1965070 RepID=A0A3S3P609_9ACAR|nr:putative ribosomal protein L13-like protein [Dinothrombium tinctorium]RWS15720.1 putative ribosomal protein L13-like protein [Dinothrombium tinctorium]RWS15727.1 putative ribosomal protein L13-like protein [Dinothrombium tinctorium]